MGAVDGFKVCTPTAALGVYDSEWFATMLAGLDAVMHYDIIALADSKSLYVKKLSYPVQMWRKVLTRLSETSWWPFPPPGPDISPEEFQAELARWKARKVRVCMYTGEWTEEKAENIKHTAKWTVPLGPRLKS